MVNFDYVKIIHHTPHNIQNYYKNSILGENMTLLKLVLFTTKKQNKTNLKLKDQMNFSARTIKDKAIENILKTKTTIN